MTEITEGEDKNVHTKGIRANVVADETVHLRKFAAMNGADVEEILPTLPH